MSPTSPLTAYQEQVSIHQQQLAHLTDRRASLGWARLAVFLLTCLASYQTFSLYGRAGFFALAAGIAILLYLVAADAKNNKAIRNHRLLLQINNEELLALNHQFSQWADGGMHVPAVHPYAADLDIFGPASVYQWLSRSHTSQGQNLLAAGLLEPQPVKLVLARQTAVTELAPMLTWRQQWQATAMKTNLSGTTERRLLAWAADETPAYNQPWWLFVVPLYSAVTLGSAAAAVLGFLPATTFGTLFSLYFFISLTVSRKATKPYGQLSGAVKEVTALQALVAWLEAPDFVAPHLQQVQSGLREGGVSASVQIKSLQRILDRFDLRNNLLVFLLINSFLLWDVRQVLALNNWRRQHRHRIGGWFAAIAEMDVLHSLATLRFNEPSWCFPVFTEKYFTLEGQEIAHPLLAPAQRVANNFTMQGAPKVGLITGSNMAGKSTFLRSLGVNMVLAQMGAPVCATAFLLSAAGLMSSMRVADNLAENTSTFYAELKKLRTIIDGVKRHERVFILLDEILRGTNSFDRHKGSSALVKQLVKEGAVALLATHDVELAALQSSHPSAIDNYHFDAKVDGEELYFDYKLKPGVCQSINASILMKKIGIDLE